MEVLANMALALTLIAKQDNTYINVYLQCVYLPVYAYVCKCTRVVWSVEGQHSVLQ